MNTYRVDQRLAFALVAGVFALLPAVLSLQPVPAAQAALPPRPTPQPTLPIESDSESALVGVASIELLARFGQTGQVQCWQELWTVVEWQDASGDWHEVEGWRGTLDKIVDGDGRKVWWVYQRDLGTGPFRWTVYRSPAGGLLAHSEPFDLPGAAGQTVTVGVALR